MLVSSIASQPTVSGYPTTSKIRVPRELEIALNGPVGPQRLRDDTIVIDEGGWYRTLTPSSSWPASNEVLFSNLNERDPDGEIDAIIAEYHKLGLPLTWCVYPWTRPADLGKRLLKRGASQTNLRAFLGSTDVPFNLIKGVEVEKVDPESTEAYEAYMNVMSSGFNLPPDEEAFRRHRYRELMAGPKPRMHLFIGRYNGVVAGCAATIIKEDSGHLSGAYVLPAFQARGVFASFGAVGLRGLYDMGISLATAHGLEQTSAPWVERFGFSSVYAYCIYQLDPPLVDIREIVKHQLSIIVAQNSPVPFPDEIDDDAPLNEFWLDSLSFTSLLVAIEKKVGYMPADIIEGVYFPETFGELVSAYANK